MITQKKLKQLLRYSKKSGLFTWRVNVGTRGREGEVAGSKKKEGRVVIVIDGKQHKAHRLAWLYMEGYVPENDIDHKDRNPTNNRWKNLRHVSRQCNSRNCKVGKNNSTGVTGVSWHKRDKCWTAQIRVNYKVIHLGRFEHFKDAVLARWNAEVEHNFPNCNTTSTAYEWLKLNKD